MDCKVGTIYRKLIVYEAMYHKACHSKYLKTKPKEEANHAETLYNATLETLMNTIEPHLKSGRAYLMTGLLKKFQTLLEQSISAEKSQSYTSQNLKRKIESKYLDKVQIITSDLRGKPDIVMDKELKLEDVVNSTAQLRDILKTAEIEADLTSSAETVFTPERIMYYAALALRSVRKDCVRIEIQPLNPADISTGA